jgi:CxxC motif-containing protein
MKRDLTCINCPLGCSLHATEEGGKITVTGNTCPKGVQYAVSELTAPKRIVTSSIAVQGGTRPLVSVKTKEAVPKEKILLCMEVLKQLSVQAPIRIGDVLLPDIAQTGVPLVATGNVSKY